MFDSLKNAILSEHSPYILKRPYIRTLFELYINKSIDFDSGDSNETVSASEVIFIFYLFINSY